MSATDIVTAHESETARRTFLHLTTGATAAFGAAAALWPFVDSMNPAKDVVALSTTEADLARLEVGDRATFVWRGQPVFVAHRTPEEIAAAQADDHADLIDPEPDRARAPQPEWLVVVGVCTHLGCIPIGQKATDTRGKWHGWHCACHGSQYDASGRVRRGPAPRNLAVPRYDFLSDGRIRIG
jgi:ubiquinol-cytochrome c reductase iron-sulfur subunit